MPLLVAGDWRTAGVLETNQMDTILLDLAAFPTTVLYSEDTSRSNSDPTAYHFYCN